MEWLITFLVIVASVEILLIIQQQVTIRACRQFTYVLGRPKYTAFDFIDALDEDIERYQFLADSVPSIIWTSTPDGKVNYYNKFWYDYTGTTFQESKDWGWKPILHENDLDMCVRIVEESVRLGEQYELKCRIRRKSDNTYRWHLAKCRPRLNHDGKIVQWVGISVDIQDEVENVFAKIGNINGKTTPL